MKRNCSLFCLSLMLFFVLVISSSFTGDAVAETFTGKTFTNSIGMKFVKIPAGTFIMGSPSGDSGRMGNERQHRVTISSAFYMQTTEVTQDQWRKIMSIDLSCFIGGNRPVERISWDDCQEFIGKLNQQEGTDKYRLPTEAEWEYACRAGTTTPFYTGRCISTDQANYDGNKPMPGCSRGKNRGKTVDVASFSPNPWGLYDMHGNVWEWCQDWYGNYQGGSVTDPKGSDSGPYRVIRGGSWFNSAKRCRLAGRVRNTPDFKHYHLGFRLARTR